MTPQDISWLRILSNFCSAAGYGLLGMVLAFLLGHWRAVGHRTLLLFGVCVCLLHGGVNALAALELYSGITFPAIPERVVGAMLLLLFAVHVLVVRDDLLITLCTSESENVRRLDRLIDQEQARLFLEFQDMQTRAASEKLLERLVEQYQGREPDEASGLLLNIEAAGEIPEPVWVKVLAILATPVIAFATYLLGYASRAGASKNQLVAMRKEVDELNVARISQGATQAAHQAQIVGFVATLGTMSAQITQMSQDVAFIRGRIDGRRSRETE